MGWNVHENKERERERCGQDLPASIVMMEEEGAIVPEIQQLIQREYREMRDIRNKQFVCSTRMHPHSENQLILRFSGTRRRSTRKERRMERQVWNDAAGALQQQQRRASCVIQIEGENIKYHCPGKRERERGDNFLLQSHARQVMRR